jgi:hypothetical protein
LRSSFLSFGRGQKVRVFVTLILTFSHRRRNCYGVKVNERFLYGGFLSFGRGRKVRGFWYMYKIE